MSFVSVGNLIQQRQGIDVTVEEEIVAKTEKFQEPKPDEKTSTDLAGIFSAYLGPELSRKLRLLYVNKGILNVVCLNKGICELVKIHQEKIISDFRETLRYQSIKSIRLLGED